MFKSLSIITKIKQALLMRLISFIRAANPQAPMIKQREFLHQIDVKKLRASNDKLIVVIHPIK